MAPDLCRDVDARALVNVFVLIAQSFQKVALLNVYAPTGTEPPFAITQGIALAFFIVVIFAAIRKFRPVPVSLA